MATSQNLSEDVSPSKLTLVPFPAPQAITQLELVTLLSLRGRRHQLEEQVETAESSIKNRLEAGRLANKLYFGKGLNYVERILRKTRPTRSVSLIVE